MLGILLHAPRGPFYSPKAARSRWVHSRKAILAFCRLAHQTVRCTPDTVRCGFLSFSGEADRWRLGAVGTPDTVRCTPDSPVCTGQCPVCQQLQVFNGWLRQNRKEICTGQCPVHQSTEGKNCLPILLSTAPSCLGAIKGTPRRMKENTKHSLTIS